MCVNIGPAGGGSLSGVCQKGGRYESSLQSGVYFELYFLVSSALGWFSGFFFIRTAPKKIFVLGQGVQISIMPVGHRPKRRYLSTHSTNQLSSSSYSCPPDPGLYRVRHDIIHNTLQGHCSAFAAMVRDPSNGSRPWSLWLDIPPPPRDSLNSGEINTSRGRTCLPPPHTIHPLDP